MSLDLEDIEKLLRECDEVHTRRDAVAVSERILKFPALLAALHRVYEAEKVRAGTVDQLREAIRQLRGSLWKLKPDQTGKVPEGAYAEFGRNYRDVNSLLLMLDAVFVENESKR